MSRYKTLAAAALVAMMAAGVARAEGTDPVIAKVGDQEIRQSELDLAITSLDPQLQRMPDEQKRAAALSAVIDVKLLLKDAEKEGLQNDEAFKQRVAFLTERELHNAFFKKHVVDAVTSEEVKARYDKEVAAIPPQEEVKARHILVKTETRRRTSSRNSTRARTSPILRRPSPPTRTRKRAAISALHQGPHGT